MKIDQLLFYSTTNVVYSCSVCVRTCRPAVDIINHSFNNIEVINNNKYCTIINITPRQDCSRTLAST